jgi:hypothetical protein
MHELCVLLRTENGWSVQGECMSLILPRRQLISPKCYDKNTTISLLMNISKSASRLLLIIEKIASSTAASE